MKLDKNVAKAKMENVGVPENVIEDICKDCDCGAECVDNKLEELGYGRVFETTRQPESSWTDMSLR